MAKELTLTLLVIAIQVFTHLSEARRPYDNNNSDDVAELMKYYDDTGCTSIGLGDKNYQQLQFYTPTPGKPLTVYAYPAQVCPSYMIFHNPTCRCQLSGFILDTLDPAPVRACRTLADISYHEGRGQYTSSTFVRETGKVVSADLNSFVAQGVNGRQGQRALRMTGVPLALESFADNELMGPWSSSLRFLPDSSSPRRVVLLSDDCTKLMAVKSLELTLSGGRLEVFMRFSNDSLSLDGQTCSVRPDVDGWYTLGMDSLNNTVSVTVNGQPCVSSPQGQQAILAQTRCPLYVGGSPKDSSSTFSGLVEYFKFRKGPKDKCSI